MIFQRLSRQQAGLLANSSRFFLRSQNQTRGVHKVPHLKNNNIFARDGVPEVMSPEGFDLAWTQYQSYLVTKLDMLTAGTADENQAPGDLLIKYAREASMASLFNYASMAHNNHKFFSTISPTPVEVPEVLEEAIVDSCSSMESLKAEFLATANAMFGPGFVWLVKVKDTAQLKILATYIAGSPEPKAHYRRQPLDMATHTTGIKGGESTDTIGRMAGRTYGAMGQFSNQKYLAPGGADIHPILCVNTWEHVWLRDWGIAGKSGFLDAWWDKVDWQVVMDNYQQQGPMSARNVRKNQHIYGRS